MGKLQETVSEHGIDSIRLIVLKPLSWAKSDELFLRNYWRGSKYSNFLKKVEVYLNVSDASASKNAVRTVPIEELEKAIHDGILAIALIDDEKVIPTVQNYEIEIVLEPTKEFLGRRYLKMDWPAESKQAARFAVYDALRPLIHDHVKILFKNDKIGS